MKVVEAESDSHSSDKEMIIPPIEGTESPSAQVEKKWEQKFACEQTWTKWDSIWQKQVIP